MSSGVHRVAPPGAEVETRKRRPPLTQTEPERQPKKRSQEAENAAPRAPEDLLKGAASGPTPTCTPLDMSASINHLRAHESVRLRGLDLGKYQG